MSTSNELDRIAGAWLAEGPAELGDRVLEAALAEVHKTRQRHRAAAPWRTITMPISMRLAAAVAIVAVVGLAGLTMFRGGIGGPGPSASPTDQASTPVPSSTAPAPSSIAAVPLPPLSAEFTSPWYGYRVAYPAGWQATSGQGPWPVGANLLHRDPRLDQIEGPVGGHSARIVGASVALPAGMGMDGFVAFASPQSSVCTSIDPLVEPVTVDGIPANVSLNGCNSLSEIGGLIWDIEVVTGGRGYDFTIDGHLTAAEAQAWLNSISLEPATALPAGPGPS
jgi:hypothetical protein